MWLATLQPYQRKAASQLKIYSITFFIVTLDENDHIAVAFILVINNDLF